MKVKIKTLRFDIVWISFGLRVSCIMGFSRRQEVGHSHVACKIVGKTRCLEQALRRVKAKDAKQQEALAMSEALPCAICGAPI